MKSPLELGLGAQLDHEVILEIGAFCHQSINVWEADRLKPPSCPPWSWAGWKDSWSPEFALFLQCPLP